MPLAGDGALGRPVDQVGRAARWRGVRQHVGKKLADVLVVRRVLEAQAFERVLLIVRRTGLKRDFLHAFESLDFDGAAENCLGYRYLLLAVDVVVLATVALVLHQSDLDDEVAGPAVERLVAPVLDSEKHPVIDGLGNLDAQLYLLLDDAVTRARFALDGADAAAEAAGARFAVSHVETFSFAARASDFVGPLLDASALAVRADLDTVVGKVLLDASIGLRKINRHSEANVPATNLTDSEGAGVGGGGRGLVLTDELLLIHREKAFVLL